MSRCELICERCAWFSASKCSANHQYGMFAKEDSRKDVAYCPEFRIDSNKLIDLHMFGDMEALEFVIEGTSYKIGKNHGRFYFVKFNNVDNLGHRRIIGVDVYQAMLKFFDAGRQSEKNRMKKVLGL